MRVNLTQEEIRIVKFIGKARRDNAQKFNKDKRISDKDPYQLDIDGFMGEFIVAKAFNLMPDFELSQFKKPYDFIDGNNHKVDVKSSRIDNIKLRVTEYHDKNPCDIYVLCIVDDTGGDIRCWGAWNYIKANADKEQSIDQFGKIATCYAISQHQLNKYE
jgi:hypothetical protein